MAASNFYGLCLIPPEAGNIRLLALHASVPHSAPLRATLSPATLASSRGSYEALSYCWGDESQRGLIALSVPSQRQSDPDRHHEFEMSITQSLVDALRHLRLPDRDRVLWVDAVCINQADIAEKSIQVRQMLDVYECSSRTVAYLGNAKEEEVDELQAAIAHRDYLRAAAATSATELPPLQGGPNQEIAVVEWDPAAGVVMPPYEPPARVKVTEQQRLLRFVTAARLPSAPDPHSAKGRTDVLFSPTSIRVSWSRFFSRPWFTRAWTTQEFVAGPDVLLQMGAEETTLTLNDISNLRDYVWYMGAWAGFREQEAAREEIKFFMYGNGSFKVFTMFRLRDHREETIGAIIHRMLSVATTSGYPALETRDARDRLWALLGLSDQDRGESSLQPDYNLGVDEVYLRFSQHIAVKGHLQFLLELPPRRATDGLPSWALADGLGAVAQSLTLRQREALPPTDPPLLSDDGMGLRVTAVYADIIESFGDELPAMAEKEALFRLPIKDVPLIDAVVKAADMEASRLDTLLLPGESRAEATFKFLRGIAASAPFNIRGIAPELTEYNHRWDGYLRPWLETVAVLTSVASFSEADPRIVRIRNGEDTDRLYRSSLFTKARAEGWPADMIRAAGVSSMAPPEGIVTGGQLLDALDQFHLVMAWYTGFWIPAWAGRKVGRTEKGYLCNLDKDARVGHDIAFVDPGRRALILRLDYGNEWRTIGLAYVHGMVEGAQLRGGHPAPRKIWLR